MKTLRPIAQSFNRVQASTSTHGCRAPFIVRYSNHNRHQHPHQRRTFLSNPFGNGSPQTISATRILPYSNNQIFAIITDVSSYSTYYPFVLSSIVTKHSQPVPTPNGESKTFPEEAKLIVGVDWHGSSVREEFWSRIYCVPDSVVEAVSGKTETTLRESEIGHHNARPRGSEDMTRRDGMLEHLLTRWTLRPLEKGRRGEEETEVNLRIEVQFANPIYAALSQAAVPRVAEKMIEAFERRVEGVVGNGGEAELSSRTKDQQVR